MNLAFCFTTFSFSAGCSSTITNNNGRITGITNGVVSNEGQILTHDLLNRIATAATKGTSGSDCWGQSFGPDTVANLTSITSSQCSSGSLSVSTDGNNHLSATGFSYDSAGNMTNDGAYAYFFDAESRMTQVNGTAGNCGSATACYVYDGNGVRVKKSTGTLYWRSPGGAVLAESDLSGNITNEYVFFGGKRVARRDSSGNVFYYFADHLGTSRIVTNLSGTVLDDSDFYPFGGERVVSSSSGNSYKFTGKERDSESGLDNFGARYNSSSMGKFMSPDPDNISGILHLDDDPQSWNGYSYVRNNPLNLTDPTGTVFCRPAGTGDPEGVTQVCDVTNANYVNSSKDQQAAYDKAGYTHSDCSCDTGADKDAWQHRNGNVSTDWIGNGLVFGAVFAGLEGLFYPQLHPSRTPTPSPQPEPVNPADQKATTHTLDGDATGGGHAPGTGNPGKSEFPAGWSRDKIMKDISDVATDPASKVTTVGRTTLVDGARDGVNIRVVIKDGRIVTGYPTNIPRNP